LIGVTFPYVMFDIVPYSWPIEVSTNFGEGVVGPVVSCCRHVMKFMKNIVSFVFGDNQLSFFVIVVCGISIENAMS
jgi:hypothetical protein